MIDFYVNSSQVSFTISGFGGFLLFTYFVVEMILLFTTKSLLIHKLFIYFRLLRQVKQLIPKWWKIKIGIANLLTITRKSTGFEVYIQVNNIINNNWTQDYVIVDRLGKIKSQKLTSSIKSHDAGEELKIKEWQRDKVLDDILS